MRRLWLTTLVLFLFFQSFGAAPYNAIWQKANKLYQAKQYDSAIAYYEKLTSLNLTNPELYYNLGNAYYKANRIGPAVLNYERALQLNPDYKQAEDNLALTQARISNRIQEPRDIFFVSWWKSLTKPALSLTWSVISLALFLIVLATLLAGRWSNRPSWLQPQLSLGVALLFVVSLLFAYISSQKQVQQDEAVVMFPDTPLMQDAKATKSQNLVPEGTVVVLEGEKANLIQVTLPDGRTGWMQKDALEKI